MLKLSKIAITGGLSCGKSTVSSLFKQLGAYTVSADEIVHHLLTPHSETGLKVIEWLGQDIVNHGEIDRSKIAERVFKDPKKLMKLESLLHPLVREEINKSYENAKKNSSSLFVAEIPLLFEAGMEQDFDVIITVQAEPEIASQRFNGSPEAFQERSARQMSLEEKVRKSHFTLVNNGSLDELKSQVQNLFNQLKSHES